VLASVTAAFLACSRPPSLGSTEANHASFSESDGGTPQVKMSLENARFDGLDLAGRFLVGVVDGQLRLGAGNK
jgi:hypothetical protein